MDSLKSQPSSSTRSKNKQHNNASKSVSAPPDLSSFTSPTPEKPPQPSMRTRNRGVVMSASAIRNVAENLRQSEPVRPVLNSDRVVDTPARKLINVGSDGSIKIPERYERFSEFFNCLDCSIRLLRMKGSMTTFTNIRPKIESLTDRRFSHAHLAQLKFILPEAIVLKKVMIHDERTSCMKPDLHVTLDAEALKDEGEMKLANGDYSRMRKVFRARLLDFVKSHPEGDDIPEGTLPEPFSWRKRDLSTTVSVESNSSINETSVNLEPDQALAVASHLSQSFHKHFSQKVSSSLAVTLAPVNPMTSKIIQETPTKLTSTPAKLISTPALQTPKRCHMMSPDDGSKKSPNKLVRRQLLSRSLKFDTPVKNTKVENVNETGCSSVYNDLLDVLPETLLQSIHDKERKIMEERDPAISQAKRRRDMIAGLPKLFDIIHFFFQSIKRSVVTKEELVHKILASHLDIVDKSELDEQLLLLQEIAPEWLSENVASSGDRLLRINKILHTELIRARLAEAQ